ncbi:hypothetical protein H0H93_007052, partial [Arthromyces matolae]
EHSESATTSNAQSELTVMADARNSLAQEDSESDANSDAETIIAVEDDRQDGEDSETISAPSVPAYLRRLPPLYNSIKDG